MKNIRRDTVDYMVNGIKYICLNYKNRSAGSLSEKECQKYFKRELGNWADLVEEETFTLHPKAFVGSIPVAGSINILSVCMFWLSLKTDSIIFPIIGVVAILFSVALDTLESFFYRKAFDFLFPRAVSRNIMARRAPKGEVKRCIIFGGHADAAYEMNYCLHGQLKSTIPVLAGSSLGMAFVFICNVALLIQSATVGNVGDGIWRILGIIEIAFIPFFIAIVFFSNWTRVVDGANDNLSACYVAMGVLKEMSEQNFRFENTEVCCLITGAEESGIRGALAYAKRHREKLSSVETIFIALDTMREIDQLRAFVLGQNGMQKNSNTVFELINEAGKNCGANIRKAKLLFGATDAEAFSRNDLQACGFCAVALTPQLYYHTRHDTWDNISEECLQLSLEVCMEAAHLYDENNGMNKYKG